MYFQPEDKHEARIAKREKVKKKVTDLNMSWKLLFFLIFNTS